jgi:hypothetical protein
MSRDQAGRFVRGKSGNPGGYSQAKRIVSERYLRALKEVWNEKGMKHAQELVDKAVCLAKAGDSTAFRHVWSV